MRIFNYQCPFLGMFLALSFAFVSCQADLSDIENDISSLKTKVSNLEEAINKLRSAYDDGKVITSVETVDFSTNGGGT